jgi:hypothetical protein
MVISFKKQRNSKPFLFICQVVLGINYQCPSLFREQHFSALGNSQLKKKNLEKHTHTKTIFNPTTQGCSLTKQ